MSHRAQRWGAPAKVAALALLLTLLAACGSTATPTTGTAGGAGGGGGAAAIATSAPRPTTAPTTGGAAASPAGGGTAGTASPASRPSAASPATSPAAGGATGPAKRVKVGVVFSLTGDAQIYGNPQRQAVQLAVDEINSSNAIPGIQLDPVFEDDASKKDQGITVFDKLIKQDNVVCIIGPTLSNTAVSTDPGAQQAGVPVLGVSTTASGITDIGDYIFRDSLAEAQVIPVTVKTAKDKLNLKKVAVIYGQDDAFTKSGYDVFKKALDDNGIQITSTQTYNKGDTDFSAQLTEIKGTTPDAIVASALINEATQIVTQARQLGIQATIIGGNGFNAPALITNAGAAAEGVIVGAAWNSANDLPENKKFIDAYKKKYNADPDQFAAQAYSGVYIIADAMKAAGPNVDRKTLRDALANVKDVKTPLGPFKFTTGRDADHPPVIQVVKSGKFDILK